MRNLTEAEMYAEAARLEEAAEAVRAIRAANPEMAPRPNRKVRDQADMRIVALAEGLRLQTRRPTWLRTLASWVAMSVGLLGMGALLVGGGFGDAPRPALDSLDVALGIAAVLFVAGFAGVNLHWPDGSLRSWHTRSVDPAVLVSVVGSRLPYRPSTHGLNVETMHQYPVLIWLVPEDAKAHLHAMVDRGEVSQ